MSSFEPLAAEATRLLGAVREHVDDGTCRYCPVCLAIGVLRGERPEVAEKLAAAGTALLVALRGAVETPPAPSKEAAADGAQSGRVQRIDLD
jgi:hypothetical protein